MSDLESVSSTEAPSCPKCSGPMWDNREGKRNPKAPDFKCRDRSCDGVIWPPKPGVAAATSAPRANGSAPLVPELEEVSASGEADGDEVPF